MLILGLGNPLLGDDGVGWKVAGAVRARVQEPDVEVDCLAGGGLSLMERLIGYDRAILVDAITSGQGPQGSVYSFPVEALPDLAAGHLNSPHDTSLQTALRLGRTMGIPLPEQVTIVAVEAESVYDFKEELTSPVAAAVSRATQTVLDILQGSAESRPSVRNRRHTSCKTRFAGFLQK
ncbi:MAG: hydrogenase maturation protease [Anaerolineae bacterium]|nr:hydrogenase maturation protease [Anaerolineae bacterium]